MRGQTFTIAIGSEIPQIGNDFFTQVIHGAARTLAGSKYQLIIAPALEGEGDQQVLDALVDRQVDGIIAISLDVGMSSLERIAEYVPVVLIGRHDKPKGYDTVTNDDEAGVTLAMTHLFDLGHRRIAHLTVRPTEATPDSLPPHLIRHRVYEARMTDRGLTPRVVYTEAPEAAAHRAGLELLDGDDRPTAIFAGNDTLAIGALRAVAELGLTSEDVAVIGYDNIELASHPLVSLSTIDQYGERTGEAAVDLLMERIEHGRAEASHVQLTPSLVIRGSSGPARR
jgi:LacI family transcriptional regulator